MLWLVSRGLHSVFSAALVKLWILLSVWASAAGWLLSALRQLNSIGYLLALALFGILMFVSRRGLDLDLTACIQVRRKVSVDSDTVCQLGLRYSLCWSSSGDVSTRPRIIQP